ncbi:MAG: hypothetical protein JXC85_04245 [Candidatus Aenigmarchaeota archaeon]|nr:hypothetical protein [Candidatus Aenigmarchaeota archaeon]
MRIDWIVAVVIFLMFVGWAFAYFTVLSSGSVVSRSESAGFAGEKVIDHLAVRVSSVPASFSSGSPGDDITLFAYVNWSGAEENSARVVGEQLSNASLPCVISSPAGPGECWKVHWNASLIVGDNHFFIEYADLDTALNCNQSVPKSDDNETGLWAAEYKDVYSAARNSDVCGSMNSSYEQMKAELGMTFDFNVLIEEPGGPYTCGRAVPMAGREVFVYPASGSLFEGGDVNISVRLW